jgi:CHAT domain-containing protein
MMVQRLKTAVTQKQLWLGLVPLISLSGITCLLLNSQSFAAIPEQMAPRIAQQPANSNVAEKVFQEGVQFFQQGTAESLRQAISKFEQAAILYRQAGKKRSEAASLVYIGYIYSSLGEKQKALEYYNQALPLYRAVGDRGEEASTLSGIGSVYDSLGEMQKALESLNQALLLRRAVGDRGGEAFTLNNIGSVYNSLGELQKALEFFNQALLLFRALGDRGGQALTLNNMGSVYNSLGEKQKALELLNQALPLLRAVGDRNREAAATLNNIGGVYSDLGENQKALEFFNQALLLRRAVGDRGGEANTLNSIGSVYSSLGEQQKALEYYNQALPLLQAVGDRGGEASIINNMGAVYNSLGEKEKALEYYNQALPLTQAVGDRDGEATTLYNTAVLQRSQGNLKASLTLMDSAITIIEDLRTKIGSQERRASYFATVQNKYEFYIDLLMQLHQQNPSQGYDALAFHASERARARSLLELLTEANANIRQGVDPKLLEQEQKLQQQLNSFDYQKYQLLSSQHTQQQVDEIKQKIDNVLLVQNEIITLPSASTVAIQRRQLQNRPTAAKTLAVLADPIFAANDSRVASTSTQPISETLNNSALTRASRNLGLGDSGKVYDRLPNTRTEAEKILALVPQTQRLQALDFDASFAKATDPNLAQYQIVHLATHGLVDPVNPELSGIVLSLYNKNGEPQDGFLRLHDIFNLNLPAELVVLSACQTGLGKETKGEGLVGLTRGFMYAGARRVVVSLWSVNDAATSELMAKFYQKMLQGGQNPITALREAQLEMWNSQNRQSPYYWAAFTVQGDWR